MDDIFENYLNDDVQVTQVGISRNPFEYSPDSSSLGFDGDMGSNLVPAQTEKPVSNAQYVSDLFNKVVGQENISKFISSYAKSRFGNSTLPTTAQGGKTQDTVGMLNPVPMNWKLFPFQSTAQPNETLAGPFGGTAGVMVLGFILLVILFAFRR